MADRKNNSCIFSEGDTFHKGDPIMCLAEYARRLNVSNDVIFAGIGLPTYPISMSIVEHALHYWNDIKSDVMCAREEIATNPLAEFTHKRSVISYGDPQGDPELRERVARCLSEWYGITLDRDNVLFTVGGAGGLHAIFKVVQTLHPDGWIVTPFPYYSLYEGSEKQNRLHPIPLLNRPGYRLTADELRNSLQRCEQSGRQVAAFLFCDPSNPLGTVMGELEWYRIAEVLRQYKKAVIIVDEAYAEMLYGGQRHVSLLSVAPDLADRIIVLRSATKAFSAAGERMAILLTKNSAWMELLKTCSILTVGHAPRFTQSLYASALEQMNEKMLYEMNDYYHLRINIVVSRLRAMGAEMPDSNYKVQGTFYVMANLSDMIGMSLPASAEKILQTTGSGKAETDEHIAYSLLFEDHIMLAPLSYFGVPPEFGYMRITCCGGEEELTTLMDRIAKRLTIARQNKCDALVMKLHNLLNTTVIESDAVNSLVKFIVADIRRLHTDPKGETASSRFDNDAFVLKKINVALENLIVWLEAELVSKNDNRLKYFDSYGLIDPAWYHCHHSNDVQYFVDAAYIRKPEVW